MANSKKLIISENGQKITFFDDDIFLPAKDVRSIERAVGILEGLSYVVAGNVAEALTEAIEIIDTVLQRKKED